MKIIFFLLIVSHCQENEEEETVYDQQQYTFKQYRDFFSFVTKIQDNPSHRDLIYIEDVFTKYIQIPRPKCPEDFTGNCKSYLFTIADFRKGLSFINKLPTVLLIGGFHGDEVTGVNSLYRLIEIFHKYGKINPQLQEILGKVKLMILPTANVTGFARQQREDFTNQQQSIDPNRDFPFNVESGGKCLQTSTSQIIDIIFRENLILSTITFHGGDNSITYPWGNFAHENPITGDNLAFKQIAELLKDFAGSNDDLQIEEYKTGTMKDVVYDVNGGFEDWAYGASWDMTNVPKQCSDTQSLPPYNRITNRAFVYLVEAGYDKTPDTNQLGNELSIFHPYDEKAIWGHISRNTFMSLKFLEYQNPYIVLDDVRYNKGLIMKLIVKGCVHISYLKIKNYPFFILSKKVQPDTGYHIVLVIIEKTINYMEDVDIEAQCDQEWFDHASSLKPQSHLVKLRTVPGYEVIYRDQTLLSQYVINSRLVNIKISEIKDAYLKSNEKNIYSYIYATEYKIKMPADMITAYWEDGMIHFETKSGHEYLLKIYNYGSASCCTNDTNGSHFQFEVSTKQKISISQKEFYELQGKTVDIYDPRVKSTLFYSHFQVLNEDPFSTMVMPANGLTCYSEFLDDYYYIQIYYFTQDIIFFDLMTNGNSSYYTIKVKGLEVTLKKNSKFKKIQGVVQHTKHQQVENFNDLRMWGAYIELFDSDNQMVYRDTLKPRNPYFDEVEQIKSSNGFLISEKHIIHQKLKTKFFKQSRESKTPTIVLLIIICIIIIAIIVFFVRRKRQEQKAQNEQTEIKELAKDDTNKVLVNQI